MRLSICLGTIFLVARLWFVINEQLRAAIILGSIGELFCFLAIFSFIVSAPCSGD